MVYYDFSLIKGKSHDLGRICSSCNRIRLPDDPAHTSDILSISGAIAADDFVTTRDLEVPPDGLILQEVAYI